MVSKYQKTTLAAIALVFLLPTLCFNQAIIQFDTIRYDLKAGESASICLNVTNGNFSDNGYEIEIAFTGSSLPHFPGQEYRKIHLKTKQYCFSLHSERPFLLEAQNGYKIEVHSLDSNLTVSTDRGKTNIKVLNHTGLTELNSKDLLFIGFDNEINTSGTDKIVLLNIPSINENMTFSIANVVPYDSSGSYFTVLNDTMISSYQVKYVGSIPIPPLSKISFQINRNIGSVVTESISNFYINGFSTQDFQVNYTGSAASSSININPSSGSSLLLYSGSLIKHSSGIFKLFGNIIDGITFQNSTNQNTLNELQSITSLNKPGSNFGFLKCNGDKYLCDFLSTTSLSQSWYINSGTTSNNLIDSTILDTCNLNPCLELPIEIVPQSDIDSFDIVMLIDNSRSITAYHFDDMKEVILDLIEDISSVYPNTRFAIVQYCNTTEFDVTVPFSYNDQNPIDFDREFVGDSYMGSAVTHLLNELDYGNLHIRDNAQYQTIIFTDANASHIIDLGYEPFNSLKSSPFYSTTSMVRYNDWPLDNPIAASTTSKGGSYFGPLDYNSNDPDGTALPRRYYNTTSFQDPLEDVLADITESNYLEAVIDTSCENSIYEWIAQDGGIIISDNGASIETNAQGTFIINITCNSSCIHSDTFNYSTTLPLSGKTQNYNVFESNEVPEVFNQNDISIKDEQYFNLNIYPTLSEDIFNVQLNSNSPGPASLSLYDINGKYLFTTRLEKSRVDTYYYQLTLSNYNSGIYVIKVFQDGIQESARIIKINR